MDNFLYDENNENNEMTEQINISLLEEKPKYIDFLLKVSLIFMGIICLVLMTLLIVALNVF